MTEAILDLDFIAPPRKVGVQFAIAPAYNALSSFCLLNEDLSGLGAWVYQTAQSLSPEELENNQRVCGAASEYLEGVDWPSFPAWLDDLAGRDPLALRDRTLEKINAKARKLLGAEVELPSAEQLLADRELYLEVIERVVDCKGYPFNRPHHEVDHRLLNDPPAWKELIIDHLRTLWQAQLAEEWEHNLPILKQSVIAFKSLDYSGLSTPEIVTRVTAREKMPEEWETCLEGIEQLIFIPSTHIGPYLLLMDCDETTARIVFGARLPQGSDVTSPTLNRTEMLMRLNALADDTRLLILELLMQAGELSAKEIMARLDLSQSSASRHLRQLSATGYLIERRLEIGKVYRLNPERIAATLEAVKHSFTG